MSGSQERDDPEFIARLKALPPDQVAWRILVDTNKAPIWRFLHRGKNLSPENAEEACQSVFKRAFESIRTSFDPERAPLRYWLFGIARNVGNDFFRWQFQEQLIFRSIESDNSCRPDLVLLEPQDCHTSPPDEAASRELKERLLVLISQMPKRYRECFYMFYLETKSIADIATALGIIPSTIHGRLKCGRDWFRERRDQLDGA